jgi:transposase
MRAYSDNFKQQMVQRLLRKNGPSQVSLAAEVGVPQTTLSNWVRQFGKLPEVSTDGKSSPPSKSRRPEDWTADERLRVVMEASGLDADALGALLRHEGLHEETLREWRKAALEALSGGREPRPSSSERKRIKQLERELERKDKALAEAAALLILKKKVQAIWGDEDEDTSEKKDS